MIWVSSNGESMIETWKESKQNFTQCLHSISLQTRPDNTHTHTMNDPDPRAYLPFLTGQINLHVCRKKCAHTLKQLHFLRQCGRSERDKIWVCWSEEGSQRSDNKGLIHLKFYCISLFQHLCLPPSKVHVYSHAAAMVNYKAKAH